MCHFPVISPCSTPYFSFSSCRVCLHYYPHCAGLWTLYPCGTFQSDQFFLGLEGHYLYLALFLGVGRSPSPGLEQIHPRHTWTGLYSGLEIQGCQRLLLCALLVSWLPGGTHGHHRPLLWSHSVFRSNGELKAADVPLQTIPTSIIGCEKNQTLPIWSVIYPGLKDSLGLNVW